MLAAKWHLKHIAVATTEGYVSRPGGAQAELLAEVNKHETDRNLDLVWAEFRNYQQGIMPAGPGARELTEFFAHIDGKLAPNRRSTENPSAATGKSSTCSPNAPAPCTWAPRTTAGSPTRPGRSASNSPAPRTPTGRWRACVTRRAARKPLTTHAIGPSGPNTPRTDQDLPRQPRPHPPHRDGPACRPTTTAPCASSPSIDTATNTHVTEDLGMRISAAQRIQNENRIRAAMDRLLRGEIPPGGSCDITTLAREAGVDRTAFYGTRPYAHLANRIRTPAAATTARRANARPEDRPDRTAESRSR